MEIFKNIENFSKYQISNFGNLKSFWGKNEKILKPNKIRYHHLNMTNDEGITTTKQIHRLVAQAFITNPQNKKEVDHIDGNKNNNNANNLRWATHSENNRNKQLDKNNTSGYKGVDFMKTRNKWRSRLTINKKNVFYGVFDTFEEAYNARIENEMKYFKEFRPTNNITQ